MKESVRVTWVQCSSERHRVSLLSPPPSSSPPPPLYCRELGRGTEEGWEILESVRQTAVLQSLGVAFRLGGKTREEVGAKIHCNMRWLSGTRTLTSNWRQGVSHSNGGTVQMSGMEKKVWKLGIYVVLITMSTHTHSHTNRERTSHIPFFFFFFIFFFFFCVFLCDLLLALLSQTQLW